MYMYKVTSYLQCSMRHQAVVPGTAPDCLLAIDRFPTLDDLDDAQLQVNAYQTYSSGYTRLATV